LVREASEGCRAEARKGEGGPVNIPIRPCYITASQMSDGGPAMKYVYILKSIEADHFYIGVTDNLRARIAKHNAGEVPHTSKYMPWRIKTYVAFSDADRAFKFEKYLKSPSGRAFAKKRL